MQSTPALQIKPASIDHIESLRFVRHGDRLDCESCDRSIVMYPRDHDLISDLDEQAEQIPFSAPLGRRSVLGHGSDTDPLGSTSVNKTLECSDTAPLEGPSVKNEPAALSTPSSNTTDRVRVTVRFNSLKNQPPCRLQAVTQQTGWFSGRHTRLKNRLTFPPSRKSGRRWKESNNQFKKHGTLFHRHGKVCDVRGKTDGTKPADFSHRWSTGAQRRVCDVAVSS